MATFAKGFLVPRLLVLGLVLIACTALYLYLAPQKLTNTSLSSAPSEPSSPHYVGSKQCQACHTQQYNQWLESDHAKAMQLANSDTVLGDFSGVAVEFNGLKTRFDTRDGQFFIDTAGENGKQQSFSVAYTFGHYPLQQYLIELADGHIQAFDIAWDSRDVKHGGQRWYHLQPDEQVTPEHPFFWSKHFQNWNSRCADCHSTNVRLNYDPADHSYDTQWSEINVACEACHGAASEHVRLARSTAYSDEATGFEARLVNTGQFVFNEHGSIAKNVGGGSEAQLNSCAGCHSRRTVIGKIDGSVPYEDQYELATIDDGLYFADGQINDEVFVYGSFLQSKMHQAGVACSNCHDPHSSDLKLEGNGVCLQCHKVSDYQTASHHHHKPETEGAACVNCHMPARLYMGVDKRRDHAFSIPRPLLAQAVGAPNACSNCHVDWPVDKLNNGYQQLFGIESEHPWASANIEGRRQNTFALQSITALANDQQLAPIQRATLMRLAQGLPAQITLDALERGLSDPSAMVRAAAVESMAFLPPQQRIQRLLPLIDDVAKSVRVAVAAQLVGAGDSNDARLSRLFNEYEQALLLTQDTPSTQLRLGGFYLNQGNVIKAKQAYERSLFIEPAFVSAMINLADIYRAQGNDQQAKPHLLRAIEIAPELAAAHYSLGLLQVREKNLPEALVALHKAQALPTAVSHYAYVYAVALASANRLDEAIEVLHRADQRWPNQPDILMTLALYIDRSANGHDIAPVLSRLERLLPNRPELQMLIQKYRINRQ